MVEKLNLKLKRKRRIQKMKLKLSKKKCFDFLFFLLIIFLIIFLIYLIFFLQSNATDCLTNPVNYHLSQNPTKTCYCFENGMFEMFEK